VVRTPEQARLLLEETRKNVPLIEKWEQTHPEDQLEKPRPKTDGL